MNMNLLSNKFILKTYNTNFLYKTKVGAVFIEVITKQIYLRQVTANWYTLNLTLEPDSVLEIK